MNYGNEYNNTSMNSSAYFKNQSKEKQLQAEIDIRNKKNMFVIRRFLKQSPIVILYVILSLLIFRYGTNLYKEITRYFDEHPASLVSYSDANYNILGSNKYDAIHLDIGSFGTIIDINNTINEDKISFYATKNIFLCSVFPDSTYVKPLHSFTYAFKKDDLDSLNRIKDDHNYFYYNKSLNNHLYVVNLNPFDKKNKASVYFKKYSSYNILGNKGTIIKDRISLKIDKGRWIGLLVIYLIGFLIIIVAWYFSLKKIQHKFIYKPIADKNMFELYHSGQRKFKCIYCYTDLNLIVKNINDSFICPQCGKYAKENQSVFDQCWNCDYIANKVICPQCEEEIHFYENSYNQEKLDNKGKDRILRKPIFSYKATKLYLIGVVYIFVLLLTSMFKDGIYFIYFDIPLNISSSAIYKLHDQCYLSFLGLSKLYLPIIFSLITWFVLWFFFNYIFPRRNISMPNFYKKSSQTYQKNSLKNI